MSDLNNSEDAGKLSARITTHIIQHRTLIFGYIMTQTGDYDDAEDIFQDVCVTVCEKYHTFTEGTNFKAWVMKITRNKILSYYRSQSKKKNLLQLTEEIAEDLGEHEIWFRDEIPFRDEIKALRQCLDKVKGKNRTILIKRYGEGLSGQEIAESINWTPNSVYVALSRIKEGLENCVKKRLSLEGRS